MNIYGHLLPSVDAALADGLDALHAAADTDEKTDRAGADGKTDRVRAL